MNYYNELKSYGESLNILYVEDDEVVVEQIYPLLASFFKIVHVKYNGKQALEQYKKFFDENNTYYNLIITDFKMPIMDGEELIKQIQDIKEDQYFIVTSAHEDPKNLISFIKLGVGDYLTKPIQKDQFIKSLYKISKKVSMQKSNNIPRSKLDTININGLNLDFLYTDDDTIILK